MQAHDLMQQALDSLDRPLLQEYNEALEECPHLVHNETPFWPFLRTERGDCNAAARRLAMYWKYRKLVFGEGRWLLPMTQTGTGALNGQDIALLRTGFIVFLKRPPPLGPIIIDDRSRLPCPADHSESRIAMYYFTIYSRDEECGLLDPGLTAIGVVSSRQRPPAETNPLCWIILREALPFRLKEFIIAQAYEGQGRELLLEYKSFEINKAIQFRAKVQPSILTGYSQKHTLQLLEQRAASRQYLPRQSFGGDYEYSQFDDWTRMRLSLEDILGAPPKVNAIFATKPPPLPDLSSHHHHQQQEKEQEQQGNNNAVVVAVKPSPIKSPLTVEEKRQRQNQYFKRHTEKRNQEVAAMKKEVDNLIRLNSMLRQNNQKLERLIAQATQIVTAAANTPSASAVVGLGQQQPLMLWSDPGYLK